MSIHHNNKFFLTSALLLLTTIVSPAVFSAPACDTTMWQFQWHHSGNGQISSGIFVLLNDNDRWYDSWYDNPVNTGYMTMSTTKTTFKGQTDTLANGDSCSLSGTIDNSNASGSFYCLSGDNGTLTAVITVGKTPDISHPHN